MIRPGPALHAAADAALNAASHAASGLGGALKAALPRRLRAALGAGLRAGLQAARAPAPPAPRAMRPAHQDRTEAIRRAMLAARIGTGAGADAPPPSALFFTTHKCASTFVERLLRVLSEHGGRRLMDYDRAFWDLGDEVDPPDDMAAFLAAHHGALLHPRGEICGPLRQPVAFPGDAAFARIFFLRDPRDVAVSAYHSFGFSHVTPPNARWRAAFEAERRAIAQEGIDAYALRHARDRLVPDYLAYRRLHDAAPPEARLSLSYDGYAADPAGFVRRVAAFLRIDLPEAMVERLARAAAPVRAGPPGEGHRRSGRGGQWRRELTACTQAELNRLLAPVLEAWGEDDAMTWART